MALARVKLDSQTVEVIARRVVELLQANAVEGPGLVDAAELARRFGVDRSWVYTHAIELGAVKLGRRAAKAALRSQAGRGANWQEGLRTKTQRRRR
jgi:hypothetical protein